MIHVTFLSPFYHIPSPILSILPSAWLGSLASLEGLSLVIQLKTAAGRSVGVLSSLNYSEQDALFLTTVVTHA